MNYGTSTQSSWHSSMQCWISFHEKTFKLSLFKIIDRIPTAGPKKKNSTQKNPSSLNQWTYWGHWQENKGGVPYKSTGQWLLRGEVVSLKTPPQPGWWPTKLQSPEFCAMCRQLVSFPRQLFMVLWPWEEGCETWMFVFSKFCKFS